MIKIGNTKVNPKGLSKVTVGGNIVWQKGSGPIDPTSSEYWGTGAKANEWTQEWCDAIQTLTDAQLATLIGKTRQVEVNGVKHEVRVIGYNHDDLATGTGKAKLTFQFTKILGDANGYSLATFWKDTATASGSNYDFINSDIRKALDGQGTGTANWFVKGETTWNSSYAGKSVLSMLPTIVQSNLKEVTKKVAETSSHTPTNYNTKLFIASASEMTNTLPTYAKDEGSVYSYWSTHDSNADRVIQQVQGSTGALTNYTSVTSGAYSGTKYCYAGYNSATSGEGGLVWLRSPNTNNSYYAYHVNIDGNIHIHNVYRYAYGVAPCFCI